jgi:hypothetical protein
MMSTRPSSTASFAGNVVDDEPSSEASYSVGRFDCFVEFSKTSEIQVPFVDFADEVSQNQQVTSDASV